MNPTDQNQSGVATPRQQIDFGASKTQQIKTAHSASQAAQNPQIQPISAHFQPGAQNTSQPPEPPVVQPTPVTSAKAAINAMYAEQAKHPQAEIVMSAREAVNAAAQQSGVQHTKSAANLHHGSIQRSMESTRTSASALLRRADEETKIDTRASSLDPLAKARPANAQKRPEREIPVVRTSLKLGAAARPKSAPVVLPPNARMAQNARPVSNAEHSAPSKLAKFLRRGAIDAQVIQPHGVGSGKRPRALSSGQPDTRADDDHSLTVKIVPTSPSAYSSESAVSQGQTSSSQSPKRRVSAARDPQMRAGARRGLKSRAQNLASKAQTAEVLGMATTRSSRFRAKPKDFSASQPTVASADSSYVMAEPPKLTVKKRPNNTSKQPSASDSLGVIESYRPENPPQPIGDKAPTGSLKAQKVAAGHVGTAPELLAIKADNTSNYSFSKKKSELDNNRYALGGESPFLKSVNVEKRPLSDNPKKFNPKVERSAAIRATEEQKSTTKSPKPGRKNQYTKKSAPVPRQDLPVRPTVIVPSNRRSKAPLVFLIMITIILGAAVGAAVYLCFFQ